MNLAINRDGFISLGYPKKARWRTKGEYATLRLVEPDRPLTKEQLEHKRIELARLHPSAVLEAYRNCWESCRMNGDKLPSAAAIQSLVTTWKFLWQYRKR